MITGELKSKIDKLWEEFWTGGIANPLTVIEQVTFLMYARMLDMNERRDEKRAERSGKPFKRRFSEFDQDVRWESFRHLPAEQMYKLVKDDVFPHFKDLAGEGTLFAEFMKDAQLMIQKPSLLVKAVNMISELPLDSADVKGDLYEYLLSKLTTAGINGQFRTPRHIIRAMVEMLDPEANHRIADPACGTAGFLAVAYEYLVEKYTSPEGIYTEQLVNDKGEITEQKLYSGDLLHEHRQHVDTDMFHGFDFDATMLRIAAMNLVMHGITEPDIHYQDTLSQRFSESFPKAANGAFDLILANPPFKGSLDEEDVDPQLLSMVKTKKTELLFVALILRMLKIGGRAGVVLPLGVLEGESKAHKDLRRALLSNQVEAIIALPHWVFKPYASVATAIIIFSKGGETDNVWFYKLTSDGYSDGAKKEFVGGSDIPELLMLFNSRFESSYKEVRSKHRFVSFSEIKENDYDLCPNIYLRDYQYPSEYKTIRLGEVFNIVKGNAGAADATDSGYDFVTSSASFKRYPSYSFEGMAICVPLVSSTGHGHASINNIHYVDGKFEAASILAVMMLKDKNKSKELIEYVYAYLATHKDDVLVPYMKGAANVSLNVSRLSRIKIPLPPLDVQADVANEFFEKKNEVLRLEKELSDACAAFKKTTLKIKDLI